MTSVSYGILMKGFGNLRNFEKTFEFYEEMKEKKIKMNEVTLGCLIDSCVKCDNLDRAYLIL